MGPSVSLVATASPAFALGQLRPHGCGATRPGRARRLVELHDEES
jgi:hypothetical protein